MKHRFLAPLAFLLLAGCVTKQEYNRVRGQLDNTQKTLNELTAYQGELESERRRLKDEVDRLEMLVNERNRTVAEAGADRMRYREKLDELQRRLEGLGTSVSAESGDVSILQTSEGTVVEIKEGVLFEPGAVEIKAKGREILGRLADEIAQTSFKIRVEGHTDTDPVVKHAKEFPHGNLQLSAARAVEVAQFLSKGAGHPVDEGRISVAGYGPYRPRSIGTSTEAKRQNRRVDIVLLDAPPGSIGAPSSRPSPEAGGGK